MGRVAQVGRRFVRSLLHPEGQDAAAADGREEGAAAAAAEEAAAGDGHTAAGLEQGEERTMEQEQHQRQAATLAEIAAEAVQNQLQQRESQPQHSDNQPDKHTAEEPEISFAPVASGGAEAAPGGSQEDIQRGEVIGPASADETGEPEEAGQGGSQEEAGGSEEAPIPEAPTLTKATEAILLPTTEPELHVGLDNVSNGNEHAAVLEVVMAEIVEAAEGEGRDTEGKQPAATAAAATAAADIPAVEHDDAEDRGQADGIEAPTESEQAAAGVTAPASDAGIEDADPSQPSGGALIAAAAAEIETIAEAEEAAAGTAADATADAEAETEEAEPRQPSGEVLVAAAQTDAICDQVEPDQRGQDTVSETVMPAASAAAAAAAVMDAEPGEDGVSSSQASEKRAVVIAAKAPAETDSDEANEPENQFLDRGFVVTAEPAAADPEGKKLRSFGQKSIEPSRKAWPGYNYRSYYFSSVQRAQRTAQASVLQASAQQPAQLLFYSSAKLLFRTLY